MVGDRLRSEHVQRGPRDLARVERGLEILVDHQRPASDVEDPHPVLALGQHLGVQPPLGVGRLGQVQRQEVGGRVDVVGRVRLLDAQLAVALGGHERVERHDLHVEAPGPLRDQLPDAPEAEDPQRLLVQLDAQELRALPAPAGQRRVRLGDVARQRQQQRHGVLGGGDRVRLRRVGDHDPALGGGLHIDVVDPHAGTTHGSQPPRLVEQAAVEARRRADQDPLVLADPRVELVGTPAGTHVDLEVLAQQIDPGLADPLGHQHLGLAQWCSSSQSMQAVSACTSDGSVAGNIPTRSWLRPSLR